MKRTLLEQITSYSIHEDKHSALESVLVENVCRTNLLATVGMYVAPATAGVITNSKAPTAAPFEGLV